MQNYQIPQSRLAEILDRQRVSRCEAYLVASRISDIHFKIANSSSRSHCLQPTIPIAHIDFSFSHSFGAMTQIRTHWIKTTTSILKHHSEQGCCNLTNQTPLQRKKATPTPTHHNVLSTLPVFVPLTISWFDSRVEVILIMYQGMLLSHSCF